MTKQTMKARQAAGDSPWEILADLVNQGTEYPDAVWKVSQALGMDAEEVAEMEDAYTNNA